MMVESTSKDGQNKNVVESSDIRAKGNIHIGDVYNHPKEVFIQPATSNRRNFGIYMLFFVAALLVSAFVVYWLNNHFVANNPTEPAPNPHEPAAKVDKKSSTQSTEHNLANRAGSAGTQAIPPLPLPAPDDDQIIKTFLRGKSIKIDGNQKIKPFEMNKYEVTVGQYYTFCKTTGHPFPYDRVDTLNRNHPMNHVSWDDANNYCKYAGGRLPTVEEWEWAALQITGTDTLMDVPEKLAISWNRENSGGKIHPVGTRALVNQVALYDIFGNVEEWCVDGPNDSLKYTKGGFYNSILKNIGLLYKNPPSVKSRGSETVGFRVVY